MAKRRRPGQKPFVPTLAQRLQVTDLIAVGMSHEDIARVIGCTRPTLRKYFGDELANGPALRRAEVLALIYASARTGNLAAQKHLDSMTRAGAAMAELDTFPTASPDVGKKAEKQAAADKVDGVFAPPSPPKLIVNNA